MLQKLNKETKAELKQAKKEKARCKKLYADQEDNELNCGPLKFIWGITSKDNLHGNVAHFYTLNDLDICYNRDTRKYLLGIETLYQFTSTEHKINYLNDLLEAFRAYLMQKDLFDCSYDPFSLYKYNDGNLFTAESLTELYYKIKIFDIGYSNL